MTDNQLNEYQFEDIIKAFVRDIGLMDNQLGSYNELINSQLKYILQRFYSQLNEYQLKDNENGIKSVKVYVKFNDVKYEKPIFPKNVDNKEVMELLYPKYARENKIDYCAKMFVDISITMTAYYHNERVEERVFRDEKMHVTDIPVMVGSILCNLNGHSYKELCDIFEEDPVGSFGQFEIKGNSWVINQVESVLYNKEHINKESAKKGRSDSKETSESHKDQCVRAMLITRPPDKGFGNSYMIYVRISQQNMITIELSTDKYAETLIPIEFIFKMFNVDTHEQMNQYIMLDPNDQSDKGKMLHQSLQEAYQQYNSKFPEAIINGNYTSQEYKAYLGAIYLDKLNEFNIENNENIKEYSEIVEELFAKEFLTNFQYQRDSDRAKLFTIGKIVNELLKVKMNQSNPTDRDSYIVKRICSSGICYAKELKTAMSQHFVSPLIAKYAKLIENSGFDIEKITNNDLFGNIYSSSINVGKTMSQSIISSSDTITLQSKQVENRLESSEAENKNNIFSISSQRNIITNDTKIGTQSETSAIIRSVHPSTFGYIDPHQSPETGKKIGMTKQKALTAMITKGSSNNFLRCVLEYNFQHEYDMNLRPIISKIVGDDFDTGINDVRFEPSEDIVKKNLGWVYLDGTLIGFCKPNINIFELRQKYVQLRRENKINSKTTIHCDQENNAINFWVDSGRIIRPLIIVYRDEDGNPYTLMTKELLKNLNEKIINFNYLIKHGVMEYISAEEQENCLIAESLKDLYDPKHKTYMFTHLDIPESCCGLVTLVDPLAQCSMPERATILTSQAKQSCSIPCLNYYDRIHKNTYVQPVFHLPILSTLANDICMIGGQNVLVAIMMFEGKNQDDSLIFNASSSRRGCMDVIYYTYESVFTDPNEFFGVTETGKIGNQYGKLDGYLARKGSILSNGDVMIAKKEKISTKVGQNYGYQDTSVVYRQNENVVVYDAYKNDDENYAKIKMKSHRPMGTADKLSSRPACKGLIGDAPSHTELPYTEEGIRPDIILNSTSIPTRMVLAQLIEMSIQNEYAGYGHVDGTIYQYIDIYQELEKLIQSVGYDHPLFTEDTLSSDQLLEIVKLFEKKGIDTFVYKTFYYNDGRKMIGLVNMGISFYQRLQKFPATELYASKHSISNPTTGEPLEGRKEEGGMRFGEMEKNALIMEGSAKAMRTIFHDNSDGIEYYICTNCGQKIIATPKKSIYKCNQCREHAKIGKLLSTKSARVFESEINAININQSYDVKKSPIYVDDSNVNQYDRVKLLDQQFQDKYQIDNIIEEYDDEDE